MPELLLEIFVEPAPPSDNELYIYIPRTRKRRLSDVGVKFTNQMKEVAKTAWERAGMPRIGRDDMLSMYIWVRLPHVFTTTAEAKHRFVIVDTHNRGKVMADAISKALGFDDSQYFHVHYHKCEGPSAAFVRIIRDEVPPEWPGP